MFELAQRENAKLRLAITGVTGSGKTLGALYIAYGFTGDWGKIAFIDTEHERGRLYAGRDDLGTGQFMYASLIPPYSPERYRELVYEAAKIVGEDGVVIVDSLSHAWNNEGGVLEIKDRIAAQQGQTSFSAWNLAGKTQNRLINSILAVNCNVIVTMRSKMDYVMEETTDGKKKPIKVGLAPVQRDDVEYEFDIVLDIGRNHIATATKDVTILDGLNAVLTPEIGATLSEWLKSGVEPERCEECGRVIRAYGGRNATELARASLENTGKKLCGPCCKKWGAEQKQEQKHANPPETS